MDTNGGYPYYTLAESAYYVSRGRTSQNPITIEVWREFVAASPDLRLEESYRQFNIDRSVDETWSEEGRTRWLTEPGEEEEYVHFMPRHIEHHHGVLHPLKITERWHKIVRDLGQNPTLEAWNEYVAKDKYLCLSEEYKTRNNKKIFEPGRVLWLDKKGEPKHLFRFIPACVWLYSSPPSGYRQGPPDPERKKMAQKLAKGLGAKVCEGLAEF